MQVNGGKAATPVAWRGFGSPQPVDAGGGGGTARRGMQLITTTIAGGQLGGLTPQPGDPFGSSKGGGGGPFGSGAGSLGTGKGSGAGAAAPSPPVAPFGASSRGQRFELLFLMYRGCHFPLQKPATIT